MNFGFLIFNGLEELDLMGPWEMITTWHTYADGPQCFTIAETDQPIRCAKGMTLVPDYPFDSCPPLDYLLVPGGKGTRVEVHNKALLAFIEAQAASCRVVSSVCTGAFILQAAGLLSGKRATTHWKSLDRLRAFPDVTVVEERFVKEDSIWTAAGVSAGIDMALALIADQASEEAASIVQLSAEYYPTGHRYGTEHTRPGLPAYLA